MNLTLNSAQRSKEIALHSVIFAEHLRDNSNYYNLNM